MHYWELEPLREADSLGVCRLCGDEQTFSNREQEHQRPAWRVTKKVKA